MEKLNAEQLFRTQSSAFAETAALLERVMPPYFFKSVTEQELTSIILMAMDIENKSGIQKIERPDRILMVYLRSAECTPVATSRQFAGKRILRSIVHQSSPLNEAGDILVVEQVSKETEADEEPPRFTSAEIRQAYQARFGTVPDNLEDAVNALCWRDGVGDLDLSRIVERLRFACEVAQRDYTLTEFELLPGGEYRITMAVAVVARTEGFYARTLQLLESKGFEVTRSYLRNFLRGGAQDDFRHKAVRLNTFYAHPVTPGTDTPELLSGLRRELDELSWSELPELFERELVKRNRFCYASANLLCAASEFVHSQLSFVDRNAYTLPEIQRFMATYPAILRRLSDAFESRFNPAGETLDFEAEVSAAEAEIARINSGMAEKDAKVRTVLAGVANFFRSVRKCNYFSERKTALAFGVDPAFMDHYASLTPQYLAAFPADRPFGVFYFWRRGTSGFQIRFAEIARGGWRTVAPRPAQSALERGDAFEQARCELFRECFVLASTQHKKNKDIYEGGSKMVTLLKLTGEYDFKTELWSSQRAVFEAFLSLINYDEQGKLRDQNIVDRLGRRDIIEIGPDENMFDEMISWMGDRAEEAGYTLRSGIISGKVDAGINHKHYGVTSFGVYQYLMRTLQYLGIDPKRDSFRVKLSGGPFGDVAGNMIKLLNAKDDNGEYQLPKLAIVAVTDGPAAVYDPAGIDREELSRLVHQANLDQFDPERLHGEGAYMIFNQPDAESCYPMVSVVNGQRQRTKIPRDTFMRMFQNNICQEAEVFIPCGGRPQTINAANVAGYSPNGTPSSRAIVEGANSFITPDARVTLQKQGVVIVKDASANKCGVITSSYEILSGILLDKDEFVANHAELVKEILDRLAFCARREAEWLFAEYAKRPGALMTDLSDEVANAINDYKRDLGKLLNAHPEYATDEVLFRHLPPLFRKRFPERLQRIPAAYRRAIAAVEVALEIVFRKKLTLEDELRQICQ